MIDPGDKRGYIFPRGSDDKRAGVKARTSLRFLIASFVYCLGLSLVGFKARESCLPYLVVLQRAENKAFFPNFLGTRQRGNFRPSIKLHVPQLRQTTSQFTKLVKFAFRISRNSLFPVGSIPRVLSSKQARGLSWRYPSFPHQTECLTESHVIEVPFHQKNIPPRSRTSRRRRIYSLRGNWSYWHQSGVLLISIVSLETKLSIVVNK